MNLPSRYKRYKAETQKVVDFLTTSTARLSAKSKAKSKQVAPSAQALEQMSEAIAKSSNAEIEIPLEIIVVLEDAIQGREECAKFYLNLLGDQAKSYRTHLNFIEVLKRIHQVFQSAVTQHRAREKKAGLELEKKAILANIFEYLTLEEGLEESIMDETPEVRSPKTKSKPKPKKAPQPATSTPIDPHTEAMFALWCFFMDMQDVRDYLYEVWTFYYIGDLSLQIAAETTNMAFTIISRAESRLRELFPDVFLTHHDAVTFLGLRPGQAPTGTFVYLNNDKGKASDNEDVDVGFQIQALFGIHAYRICSSFLALAEKDVSNETKEWTLKQADSWHPFASLLYRLIPDIKILQAGGTGLKTDFFTELLVEMYAGRYIRSCTVVAVQTYMMIHDILGAENFGWCVQEMRLRSELAKKIIENRLELGEKKWVTYHRPRALLIAVRDHIQNFISEDGIMKLRKEVDPAAVDNPKTKYLLFKSLPVLAGHIIFETNIFLHINGIQNSTTHFSLLAAAYLYKAARSAGLTTTWPDMDFVIKKHSRPGAFVFDESTSLWPLHSMAQHFCLAMGVEPSRLKESGALEPGAEFIIPIVHYHDKLVQQSRQLEVELPFLAEMMKENESGNAKSWGDMAESALIRIALQLEGPKDYKLSTDKRPAIKAAAAQMQRSTVDLMHALRLSLAKSEADMNFKYLDFWHTCTDILSKVVQEARIALLKMPQASIPVDFDFQVITAMLWQAAYAEKPESNLQMRHTWLVKALPVLEEELEKHGADRFSSEASKTCGGQHMAKMWKPINRHVRKPNVGYGDALSVPPGLVVFPNSPVDQAGRALTRFEPRTSMLFTKYVEEGTGRLQGYMHQYLPPGT